MQAANNMWHKTGFLLSALQLVRLINGRKRGCNPMTGEAIKLPFAAMYIETLYVWQRVLISSAAWCRLSVYPRSGASLTAIGEHVYLYGGQFASGMSASGVTISVVHNIHVSLAAV
eukprot:scaffold122494_cov39-Prasinocladus_malaysianus.AAC.1